MNWSLLLSGLALCVSLGTVIYVQRRTDRRELTKWRRDTLMQTTANLLQAVSDIEDCHRKYLLSEDPNETYQRPYRNEELKTAIDRLIMCIHIYEICECDELSSIADGYRQREISDMVQVAMMESHQEMYNPDLFLKDKADLFDQIKSDGERTDIKSALQKAIGLKNENHISKS
ncbi:hypothetical protein [Rhodococcus sp. NPDC006774]|uniref:hypothetical protein n=1 Tax=Rhodococcus sp. NPDC006774 TaxID=3157186 RepID=UPI0033C67631